MNTVKPIFIPLTTPGGQKKYINALWIQSISTIKDSGAEFSEIMFLIGDETEIVTESKELIFSSIEWELLKQKKADSCQL